MAKCPRCINGTWLGPNGARWRCTFCGGTGKGKDPELVCKACGGLWDDETTSCVVCGGQQATVKRIQDAVTGD